MEQVIDEAWRLYHLGGKQDFVVKPSIPILYFGDLKRYLKSPLRIITVALNPSRLEFPDENKFGRFPLASNVYPDILSGKHRDDYQGALNEYFREWPYTNWFNWFDAILRGLDASYFDGFASCALHTDLCSPLATDPTWSNLGQARASLEREGIGLWHRLAERLEPDVVLISIARHYRDQIKFVRPDEWQEIFSIARQVPGKKPYVVLGQRATLNGTKATLFVFGKAAQQPFATLTKDERQQIGRAIQEVNHE